MRRTCAVALVASFALAFAGVARANFTAPTIVSLPEIYPYSYNFSPDVVEGNDGRLHAFWASDSWYGIAPTNVLHSYSDDGGRTWSASARVAIQEQDFWRQYEGPKSVVAPDGLIHVTYNYQNFWVRIGNSRYARSADNGLTWSNLHNWQWGGWNKNGNIALGPAGGVAIAWDWWTSGWMPQEAFLRTSADGGLTWSGNMGIRTPAMLITNRNVEARAFHIDPAGLMHVLLSVPGSQYNSAANTYAVSSDGGLTWQDRPLPAGFLAGGIYQYGGELLVAGSDQGRAAFIRSVDGGLSWEGPVVIAPSGHATQLVSDGAGTYHALAGNQHYLSRDRGATWSAPEYVAGGTIAKLLLTRSGQLLAIGTFGKEVGVVRYVPPDGVRAPQFLSLWEKGSFSYPFEVLGSGDVQVSLPAENVEVATPPAVTIGGQPVAATSTVAGDRIVVSVPVSVQQWTSGTLAMTVKKGTMKKIRAIRVRAEELTAQFAEATAVEDGARADASLRDLHLLDEELATVECEFTVSLLVGGSVAQFAKTAVSLYEDVTAVYSHFRADPRGGAELLILTDQAIAATRGEPLMLQVKVTGLREGQVASASAAGSFETIDALETNAVGTRKTDYHVFFPPTTPTGPQTVTFSVTVDGVTSSVPLTVDVR